MDVEPVVHSIPAPRRLLQQLSQIDARLQQGFATGGMESGVKLQSSNLKPLMSAWSKSDIGACPHQAASGRQGWQCHSKALLKGPCESGPAPDAQSRGKRARNR